MKRTNNAKYRWMYLGEAIGGGIVPFENLKIKQISDETIKTFDNIKQGIDWGYSSDAFCFGRLHYDKLHDSLFIFDQLYGIKISEVRICAFLAQKKYFERIVADCSEQRSIDRLKDKGFNVVGAKKGAGSVEFGEKWLSERTSLVIDPARCPDIAWEFENIDYQTDRFGEVIPRLEDKYNHSIDMTRYALEDDMRVSDGIW
jgi:phage terminase large subunit